MWRPMDISDTNPEDIAMVSLCVQMVSVILNLTPELVVTPSLCSEDLGSESSRS